MRGTRLGAQSLESDTGVQPAARQDVTYHCPHGHTIVVPLSVKLTVPVAIEGATVAVKVTVVPACAGEAGLTVNVVVEFALFTVCVRTADVLVAEVALPV